ncbi:MAG: hypothetical protein IJ428_02460 [Clostridia bacterium]|nr:hypothetical protein [Clostridia bacterium]
MSNEYKIKKEHLIAKIHVDDDNIADALYSIIEIYFREKYNMDGDVYKRLQDATYNYRLCDKIETILNDIDEDIQYIPELLNKKD